jgi:hypothetical protein
MTTGYATPSPHPPTVGVVSARQAAFLRIVTDTARKNANKRGAVVVYEAEGRSGVVFMPRSELDRTPAIVQWFVDTYDMRSEFVVINSTTGEILRVEY